MLLCVLSYSLFNSWLNILVYVEEIIRIKFVLDLYQLLVVIAIIGVLVALLLPAVQAAREAARRMQCLNHERQLAIAAHQFHDANKNFPPGVYQLKFSAAPQYRGVSLYVKLLPYLEQDNIYNQMQADTARSFRTSRASAEGARPVGLARLARRVSQSSTAASSRPSIGIEWPVSPLG